MAGRELAVPTFVAGPQDSLATVDVYVKSDAGVVNKIQDASTVFDSASVTSMQGGSYMANNLPSFTSAAQSGLSLNNGFSLSDRISSSSNPLSAAIKGLTSGTAAAILRNIPSNGGIVANVAGRLTNVTSGNLTDMRSVSGLVNGITGANTISFNDRSGTVGLLAGAISQATRNGLPNSFGAVAGTVQDTSVINRIAAQVLPDVLARGDMSSLSSMAHMTTPGSLQMINPSILTDCARKYVAPPMSTANDFNAQFSNTTSTFSAINPLWNQKSREGGPVVDISSFQGASPDFLKTIDAGAMQSTDPDEKLYRLASVFPATDPKTELKKQFAFTVMS